MSKEAEDISEKPKEEAKVSAVLLEKGEVSEFLKTACLAVFIALVIRSVFFEPFHIPSSSMKPTLLVGDYLFVNKPSYGYSRFSFPFGIAPIDQRIWAKEPLRGDVVVFARPGQTGTDYIKRVIGLPGDIIQVRNGRLYINNEMVERERVGEVEILGDRGRKQIMTEYIETLPDGAVHSIYEVSDREILDNTDIYTVPQGHYFMMGDNRDNSQDSRVSSVVGPVPFENIIGRADFLFYSTNGSARIYEFWKWPWTVRLERLFMDIDPMRENEQKDSK
jgi:signal peptidase I